MSNILLVTVRERQREIGVRRAIGAKPRDIRKQFMSEAIFIIVVAGALGILLGLSLIHILPKDADDGAPSKYELYISDKPLDKSNYTKASRLGHESGYVSGMNKEAGEELSYDVSGLKHLSLIHI